ncbi:hypothetical protein [Vibrio sp. ER1A]|uniref:hypothetical protein n=1 Tax=Vibrio sp. ER1A TaxID=1517681 RepID=UPI0004DCC8B5|nr:hypothetical protein [Vibrio sp. ER1A]KFA96977.1 hypothetical protein HW45_16965 [Vibrio sp. ER1A]
MRTSLSMLHRTAAIIAFGLILSFFTSSVLVELFGSEEAVTTVKTAIFFAVWVLIPCMAIAGITGSKLAPKANKGVLGAKKKRMPFIAVNGMLVLLPCAIYLHTLASKGQFDHTFYWIQGIEFVAGFINLTLMGLNIRDGLRLKNKRSPRLSTEN